MSVSLTRQLVQELKNRLITRDDLDIATYYTLDFLGSYMGGGITSQGQKLREYSRLIGDCGPEPEAFLAAALSHITETDDLHRSSVTHPACVVIPVALELARHLDLTGKIALESVVVGYETMIRIGDSLGSEHYKVFHNTATAGVFGAASAAAYLLELNENQWVWALGNAGTQASGLWQFNTDASMSKHLHAGHAAQAGIKAALLAMRDFTGPEFILEGDKGFYKGFCPNASPEKVTERKSVWRIAETSIKPYPSCRHTHPAIDVALALREKLLKKDVDISKEVKSIKIFTYDTSRRFTDNNAPETTFAAKFSIQYCVVTALLNGFPQLPDFEGDRLEEYRKHLLVKSTQVVVDDVFDAKYPSEWGSAVEITLNDGSVFRDETFAAKGDPEKPVTMDELKSKVLGNFVYAGLAEDASTELFELFTELKFAEEIPKLHWNTPSTNLK